MATLDNSDQWIPYDEDDNSNIDSDDAHSTNNTSNIRREQNDFILSTCVINSQYHSIEIHGADLNNKIIHTLFEQIHNRLLQITSTNNNTHEIDSNINEEKQFNAFDISLPLFQLSQTLTSFRLIYVAMTPSTLLLLLNIIELCKHTLIDIEMELLIPVKLNNDFNEIKIIGLFDRIMNMCSSVLLKLENIGIDLVNFPMECYEYFNYFDPFSTFKSLNNLQIFICKENCINNGNIESLLNFISHHKQLNGIRITINDIEDDGIWDELLSITPNSDEYKRINISRFELFEGDIIKFNKICFDIISTLNASNIRCKTLKAFSLCHYLSRDISEYIDILSQFIGKHCNLSEINILFNSMSDLYLSKLLRV
eukprot:458779_1